MIERPLDDVSLTDIEALRAYSRTEGSTLDFKESFPSADHKGVRDFLADVTAFANTDGGDIVVGVREDKNGIAAEIVGIDRAGIDEGLRRIDDQLRSCVDPRVPLFRVREILLHDDKVVLVRRALVSCIDDTRAAQAHQQRDLAGGAMAGVNEWPVSLRRPGAPNDRFSGGICRSADRLRGGRSRPDLVVPLWC